MLVAMLQDFLISGSVDSHPQDGGGGGGRSEKPQSYYC